MPLDPADGPRLALDAFHLASVPLGFILLFCKLWDDAARFRGPSCSSSRSSPSRDTSSRPRTISPSKCRGRCTPRSGTDPREARPSTRSRNPPRRKERLIWRRRRRRFRRNRRNGNRPRSPRPPRAPPPPRAPYRRTSPPPRGTRSVDSLRRRRRGVRPCPTARGRSDRVCSADDPGAPRWMTFRGPEIITPSASTACSSPTSSHRRRRNLSRERRRDSTPKARRLSRGMRDAM